MSHLHRQTIAAVSEGECSTQVKIPTVISCVPVLQLEGGAGESVRLEHYS